MPDDVRDLRERWGRLIRDRRKSIGLSQNRLAQKCGLDRQRIWRIELGEIATADHIRIAIAAALDTKVERLFPYPVPRQTAKPTQDRGVA